MSASCAESNTATMSPPGNHVDAGVIGGPGHWGGTAVFGQPSADHLVRVAGQGAGVVALSIEPREVIGDSPVRVDEPRLPYGLPHGQARRSADRVRRL
ncbi:hypothetical protein QLR68_16760, partial [Micromonospora sp. DH15]|nr:hypothetical protein [Micromonospora sp. DH15]